MCLFRLREALASRGIGTQVLAAPLSQVRLPSHLRAAVVAPASSERIARTLCAALSPSPVLLLLEREEPPTGLFSLSDDVRALVGVGETGALAVRFFTSLRGGYALAVPDRPSARGIFARTMPAGRWKGVPLRPADAVLFDAQAVTGRASCYAQAALALLCEEEHTLDFVFGEGRAPELCAFSPAETGAEALFAFDALCSLAADGAEFSCLHAARLLKEEGSAVAYAEYYAKRYSALFSGGTATPWFVPDYAARALRAAQAAGSPAAAFSRVRVPTYAQSCRLWQTFCECREKFSLRARLLSDSVARVRAAYFSLGGKLVPCDPAPAHDLSAELSPHLSLAALERELGRLPNPPQADIYRECKRWI